MTKGQTASGLDTVGDIARTGAAAVMTVLRAFLKLIATIWRIASALDGALWNGFKHFVIAFSGGVGVVSRAIWRGMTDFARWLPTRPGRAYSAISGIVLIIAGLWITDELVLAPREYQQTSGERPVTPVDKEDPILARMGGKFIHLSDITIAAASGGQLREGERLTPETAFSRGLVESYVEQRLLARAAIDEGLQRNGPVARRVNVARDRILAAAYLDDRIKLAVTPEIVEAFYRSQAGITLLGDEVKARHIVVATQEEAVAVLQSLVAGADFAAVAKEKSLDRSTAPLGGEIGYFTKDMVTPAFSKAAFSADPDNFAPLFETEFGWHVLEVTDRRPTKGISFDKVKGNIERFLTMRMIDNTLEDLAGVENVIYYRVEPEEADLEVPEPTAATDGVKQ